MPQYHIVWNADRTEGFITDSRDDATVAASNKRPFMTSTLGAEFQSIYEDQKRTIQTVDIHPELSARAVKLLDRIKRGEFYPTDAKDTPKAMQELLDYGLVGTMGRVESLRQCYVAQGHTPFVTDKAPGED